MADIAEVERVIAQHRALEQLRHEMAHRLGDDPAHDLSHALRVAAWTLRLAPEVAPVRAIAAALLHDGVPVEKSSPERAKASAHAADLARELLPALGFDAAAIDDIAVAIRDHSYSRGAVPETPLGRGLQDADRLEALGALGLMRCISTGSRMKARYFHANDPWAERRELDDRAFSVDHFFTKLLRLPSTLCTAEGRREAEHRAAFLRTFLTALESELGVPMAAARRLE